MGPPIIHPIDRATGQRVSNVIVMGMGEPLDNFDNLLSFIRLLSNEKGIRRQPTCEETQTLFP